MNNEFEKVSLCCSICKKTSIMKKDLCSETYYCNGCDTYFDPGESEYIDWDMLEEQADVDLSDYELDMLGRVRGEG